MSLWTKIETAPAVASWFAWRLRFGAHLPGLKPWFLKEAGARAQTVPCPFTCGCVHRVLPDNRATCDCGDCEDIELTEAEVKLWQPNWVGLGEKIRDVLVLERRAATLPVARVWQIGAYEGALAVILVVQPNRTAFNEAIAQVVARLPPPFAVLTPTVDHNDIEAKDLLGRQAQLFDLESNVVIGTDGKLAALKSAPELFGSFVPGIEPVAAKSVPATVAGYQFSKSGCLWRVVFDGCPEFHVEDTLGAKYLHYLLNHPNEPISCFDLEVAITPEKGMARDKDSIHPRSDGEAVRKYLQELEKLRADRDEAAEDGDQANVDRLDDEIEVVGNELKKRGQSVDTGERARSNVSKAIIAVRKKLLKRSIHEKAFGEYLKERVSLGYNLIYNDSDGIDWR